MRSLYDDIVATLQGNTFTIANVTVRDPFDESPKTYPAIIVHEIDNRPVNHATVNGEQRTDLSYQFDIQTSNCVDAEWAVLSRWQAGRRLRDEVADLLSTTYKFTRRTTMSRGVSADVCEHILRGDCVLDSYGYSYRP